MKILVISNMYPSAADPSYGTFVRNFYEDIVRRNAEADTRLVTIRGRRGSKWAKLAAYIRFYASALHALTARSYDMVYVHTVTFPTPALRIASWLRRLPLVLNVHGDDVLPQTSLKKRLKEMSRPLMAGTRLMVVPSAYFADVVRREFPELDPGRIYVSASGGVDRKFFVDRPDKADTDAITLGFVSRIDPGKGWAEFVRLVHDLRMRGIDCRAVMAGGGSQQRALTDAIVRAGLSGVIDYRGPLSQQELVDIYRHMDLFIFPTVREQESLGLVALEAMAAGVPVVASDMAGPTSYVHHGINGYLFEPGNVDAMADSVASWIALAPDARERMSREAVATAGDYEARSVADRLWQRLAAEFKR
ncbi:MAG: glycosyltransferase family 4 protein [Bacteroidales bacterium]|nr:glycosyltransferase family 4 protein [Bacteroidales bacterium]